MEKGMKERMFSKIHFRAVQDKQNKTADGFEGEIEKEEKKRKYLRKKSLFFL